MTTTPEPDQPPQPATRSSRKRNTPKTLQNRVVRLVVTPSIIALAVIVAAATYFAIFPGVKDVVVASGVRQVSLPAVTGLSSLEQERQLTVVFMAQRSGGDDSLLKQRRTTTTQLATLKSAAAPLIALPLTPSSIISRWRTLSALVDQLPTVRSQIDAGSISPTDAFAFYNRLLDAATSLFDAQARTAPDATATQRALVALEVFRAGDMMSRTGSIIAGALGTRRLSTTDYQQFVALAGGYHAHLTAAAPDLLPDIHSDYLKLLGSDSWKRLVATENALVAAGPWHGGAPSGLSVSAASWESLTTAVSTQISALTLGQADEASAQALSSGEQQLTVALIALLVALAIAIAATVRAVNRSRILVGQSLTASLTRLGDSAAEAVDQQLPDMMRRIRDGEPVDQTVTLVTDPDDLQYGEIQQLAAVIGRAVRQASGAALSEARSRAAGLAMLVGAARRSQAPINKSIADVTELQRQVDDADVLKLLFNVDHLLHQIRRQVENQIIIGGGQVARRRRNPVPLRTLITDAIAETHQFERIKIRSQLAEKLVLQHVAGPITHLLAELLDNGLEFSKNDKTVYVESSIVARGLAIEIEDAGFGMEEADLELYNRRLTQGPASDIAQLGAAGQLGYWVVADLADRYQVHVGLGRSSYGGVRAVVVIPNELLTDNPNATPTVEEQVPIPVGASSGHTAPEPVTSTMASSRPPGYSAPAWPPAGPSNPAVTGLRLGSPGTGPTARVRHQGSDTHAPGGGMNGNQQSGAYPDDSPPDAGPSHAADTGTAQAPLSSRRRGAHLAPELLSDAEDTTATQLPTSRSPEETRDRLGALQRGSSEARRPSPHGSDPRTDGGGNP